jgi:Holliday junction resolvase RusA-like endonuclease
VLVSQKGRAYRKNADIVGLAQVGHIQPLDVPVRVTMHVVTRTRAGDLDNRIKPTLDALQGLAYDDDKRVVEIHATRGVDRENPRVEITVEEAAS